MKLLLAVFALLSMNLPWLIVAVVRIVRAFA